MISWLYRVLFDRKNTGERRVIKWHPSSTLLLGETDISKVPGRVWTALEQNEQNRWSGWE